MWTPLHLHSHFSLLDGAATPKRIADRCEKLGYGSCALTDHGSVSGAVQFHKEISKRGMKPILGCEFYLSEQAATTKSKENRSLHHLVVLAKNYDGWLSLVRASSRSNREDTFYYQPRLDLDMFSEYTAGGNLVAFSGHVGSALANCLFSDVKAAYNSKTIEEARTYIHPDWKKRAVYLAKKHEIIFGRGNFFLEIQLVDKARMPVQILIADMLREVSLATCIECVATADSHYCEEADAIDQRVLLCSSLRTTINRVNATLARGDDATLGGFFISTKYHIPSYEEIALLNTPDEINNANKIAEMCETYTLKKPPMLPSFDIPDGFSSASSYFTELARRGLHERFQNPSPEYVSRLEYELKVLNEANLAGYFLIVQDFQQWARSQGWLLGPSRGSSGGSLVSYCLRITNIDPIEYNLYFERFYNAGRNTAEHISLPDIDCDFPASKRGEVMDYIRNKYGRDKVAQICTFDTLQGRKALTEVMRAWDVCTFDEQKAITANIPGKDKISDQLQEMEEAGETPSVILWALENEAESLKEWAYLNKEGKIEGPLAQYFEQAIRLEGLKHSQSKHACGVIISSENLSNICPMVRDKSGKDLIVGFEMTDAEYCGQPKFDILGITDLDNIMGIIDLVNGEDKYD